MKYKSISNDEEDKIEVKPAKRKLPGVFCAMVFLWLAVNIFAYLYINNSNTIYFWDNATYWDIARKLANGTAEMGVYGSIGSMDYNYVAGVISAFFIKLFGESRLCYVLGLVNLYIVPSFAVVYILAKRIGKAPGVTLAITFLICPAILYITLLGFADIGGILICLTCYMLYYPKHENKHTLIRHIAIGALLVLMMIWRRWYAFFAVSFLTAMVCDTLLFKGKKLPVLITVAISGLILLFGFYDFLTGILLRDYGNLYAGYKFSISTDLKLITRYFGLIFIVSLFVSSVAVIIKKREIRLIFMWIQIIVCFLMFVLTQTHGQQHLLLYVPSIIMVLVILIKHITRAKMLILISILAILNTVNILIPRNQPKSISEIKTYALLPNFSIKPPVREDARQIFDLKKRLDNVVEEGKTLGVLASSFKLNEDILKNVEPSLGVTPSRKNYIVSLPQVDSRDTDMSAFYNVNYILTATPAQTHLAEGNQRVVEEALKSFEAYADFAASYDELPQLATEIDGIEIKLYKRNRMVKEVAMREFERRLLK